MKKVSQRNVIACAMAAVGLSMSVVNAIVSSKLQIHIPKELKKPGNGYEHKEALFGIPPYGGSIQKNVVYAAEDLCTPIANPPWRPPYILFIDRGGCTFVQKIRNAQRTGAAAAIIADDRCLCKYSDCVPDEGEECEEREPIMADDGSGSDVSIPSFLMYKQDADLVRKYLVDGTPVNAEMAWKLPTLDDRVEYDLWLSPKETAALDFLSTWKEAAIALGDRVSFTPHMYIYDGVDAGCQQGGEDLCYNLCTNKGRYCATDPDNNLDEGTSGADVVEESLRRQCIYLEYGKDGIAVPWWEYNELFIIECDNDKYFNDKDCVNSVMTTVGINPNIIENCMKESGGLAKKGKNIVLQDQLGKFENAGIVILPVVSVNGVSIRGALDFAVVFKAICAGFMTGTEPSICKKCANCPDEYECVLKGGKCKSSGSVSTGLFVGSMMALVFGFSCWILVQYKRQQQQVQDQVKGILAEYMPLDNNKQNGSTSIEDDDDDFDIPNNRSNDLELT